MNGSENLEIPYGVQTSDPGCRANDETDNDLTNYITSDWSSVVNVNITGNYKVTYRVSDKSGNEATAVRNVTVKMNGGSFYGQYSSQFTSVPYGSSSVFTSTISAGGNINQFNLYPFHGALNAKINVNGFLGSELSFLVVSAPGYSFTGTGYTENFGQKIVLTYTASYDGVEFKETLTRK